MMFNKNESSKKKFVFHTLNRSGNEGFLYKGKPLNAEMEFYRTIYKYGEEWPIDTKI